MASFNQAQSKRRGSCSPYFAVTKGLFTLLVLGCIELSNGASKYHTVTRHVYLDVQIGSAPPERITIGLFGKSHPRTTENFVRLATDGINGDPSLSYRGSRFHRVIKRFMIQGGDVVNKDGTGRPMSALGTPTFPDEPFAVNHTIAGFVSMANSGPDTNACQFFITAAGTPWLDGINVAFGKVVAGMDVVYAVTSAKTDWEDRPKEPVVIVDSGLLPLRSHYDIPEDPYDPWEWIKAGIVPIGWSCLVLSIFQYMYRKLNV